MMPNRWAQIEQLYHAALEREVHERERYLAEACAGDELLRLEVESLLSQETESAEILHSDGLASAAATALVPSPRGFLVGKEVGSYQIISLLGAGGMGEVYRARDRRLQRDVALKVLPPGLLCDEHARSRFRKEALALAKLNHPNIAAVYDVGEQDGLDYLVMECVPGEPLDQKLRSGPLSLNDILSLGQEIAAALEEAHGQGVIHRDLKPANILVTPRGHAKILDFGVAKVLAAAEDPEGSHGFGETRGPVGTPVYMSPEQVGGKPLDPRTDLFSFGIVLYGMATSTLPFAGQTWAAISNSICNHAPVPVRQANPDLPAEVERIINKCLEKDCNHRYQHASEICADLRRLQRDQESKAIASRQTAIWAAPRNRWKTIVGAGLSVLALVIAGYFYFHPGPKLTERDTVVLAEFSNTTGDPVFDETLRQGVAVQLQQSPLLSLISEERVRHVLRLMGKPADARLTPEIAREICERTGSAAVLDGSITRLGNEFVLGISAKDCRTGDIFDQEQAQAARKEEVLNTLGQIARQFRTRMGESLTSIQQHSMPLAEATTPSLEALKAYSTGLKVTFSAGSASAIPLLKRAVAIDPEFAMAQAQLGLNYSSMGESVLSRESTIKAYQLRDRASEREKFFITVNYERSVTGNLEKAQQTCELWAQTYPRDPFPHGLLSGFINQGAGKYEQSIEEAKTAIRLDPDLSPAYLNLAFDYFYLDRPAEVENVLRQATARHLEMPEFFLLRYFIAFLNGNQPAMQREVAQARGIPGAEDWMTHVEALVLAYSGHVQQARKMSGRAVSLAEAAGNKEREATYEAGTAVWEALFGNAPAARRSAEAALALSRGRDVEYAAAFAMAVAGDSARPRALAKDLEERFPEDTCIRFNYLPTLRGLAALNQHDPARAIQQLQVAAPYELAVPGINFFGFFGTLYPAYVRGEAYLAARQGDKAATEFQKILHHRGIVFSDPASAAALLQLARAYVLAGDESSARSSYDDFLVFWRDADADIPILRQAKAEYAKLQVGG